MHNINYIRENPVEFDNFMKTRGENPIANKIIEIDFYELIKIVLSGVWIIALFTILGILIAYIYYNNNNKSNI